MKIDSNRIAQIAEAAKVSFELADEIVNSWDSEEHVEWVNTAEIQEVASWMKSVINGLNRPRLFSILTIEIEELTANDLKAEATKHRDAQAIRITIYDIAGGNPEAQQAEGLFIPSADRLGIAWGGPATWGDAITVDSGVDMWLNDSEGWAAAN